MSHVHCLRDLNNDNAPEEKNIYAPKSITFIDVLFVVNGWPIVTFVILIDFFVSGRINIRLVSYWIVM